MRSFWELSIHVGMPKSCPDFEQVDLGLDWLNQFPQEVCCLVSSNSDLRCSGSKGKADAADEFKRLSMCLFGPHTRTLRWLKPGEVFGCTFGFLAKACAADFAHMRYNWIFRARRRRRNGRRSERWNLRAARHFHSKWFVAVTGDQPGHLFVLWFVVFTSHIGFHSSIRMMPMVCARPADRFTLDEQWTNSLAVHGYLAFRWFHGE